MKISFRIWLLTICLALGAIAIINGTAWLRILAGLIVILSPLGISYAKSDVGKIFIAFILISCLAFIVYNSAENGVIIKSIEKNSSAYEQGLRNNMVITSINGNNINNIEDYSKVIQNIPLKENETKLTIKTTDTEFTFLNNGELKISVEEIKRTNIKTGLDLSGGARALINAEKPLDTNEMSDLIAVTNNRLNVFGISDVSVKQVSDLQGNNFMLVEVAGASPTDLKDLIAKQGKFEAKIGNQTVFRGGEKDISDVCRNDATCAGVTSCFPTQGGYGCNFRFSVYLTEDAAKAHADMTRNLTLDDTGKYLSEKLYLYVDDQEVDSLLISEGLKGQIATEISIQGSGVGTTQEEALREARNNMHQLQTILITGSLPYKLNLVKLDTISPVLGKEFTKNILTLGLGVFAIICAILFIKYRKIKITLAVILTVLSEAILTLAIASLIKWNLDAPSIAGIIAGMGTGVNDQIIIIDESVSKETTSLKERIKRALFIILGAFFTIVAAMLPLFWAGTGLLRGFALTTIIGITVGILITRPAFADMIRQMGEN